MFSSSFASSVFVFGASSRGGGSFRILHHDLVLLSISSSSLSMMNDRSGYDVGDGDGDGDGT